MTEPMRILLVEDNPADVDLTLDSFKFARVTNEIDVCRSGEEAMEYLAREGKYANSDHELPGIILLDLKMPGVSGLDVLRWLKQRPVLKRIPVIILTSSDAESDRLGGYENGASSYLVKPVTVSGFLEVAKSVGEYWLTFNQRPPLEE